MNDRSHKPGKGAKRPKVRRIVRGAAEVVPKLRAASPDIEPPQTPTVAPLNRKQLRELAADELLSHALDAAKAIGREAKSHGRRARGEASRDSLRKWLLEQAFTLVAAPDGGVDDEQQGVPLGTPLDELAERRAALRAVARAQRRDMNGHSGKD